MVNDVITALGLFSLTAAAIAALLKERDERLG